MLSSAPVPVIAAQDGTIAYARTATGSCTLCIDHAGGWSTQYSDLGYLLVRPTDRFRRRRKERVQAGDVIGHVPRSSLRIRFALTRLVDDECVVVDPCAWMRAEADRSPLERRRDPGTVCGPAWERVMVAKRGTHDPPQRPVSGRLPARADQEAAPGRHRLSREG
jgi:hypothetical protein